MEERKIKGDLPKRALYVLSVCSAHIQQHLKEVRVSGRELVPPFPPLKQHGVRCPVTFLSPYPFLQNPSAVFPPISGNELQPYVTLCTFCPSPRAEICSSPRAGFLAARAQVLFTAQPGPCSFRAGFHCP